jgi:predicted TPR repeat methyltransferase
LQALDLYATIEEHLDFKKECEHLYNSIAHIIFAINPTTVIDIGCGQGDFCQILESNGIKCLGVDLSEKQVKIAKSKGVDAKCINIKDCQETFDCATAIFDVLNYIPTIDLKEFLTHTYNLLEQNGYFIFDINSLYGFEEVAQGTLTIDLEDRFIAIDANFQNNYLSTDITLFTQETTLYKKDYGTIKQYYHTNKELKKILQTIGFKVEKIIDFNLHSDEESDKFIFICKKKD